MKKIGVALSSILLTTAMSISSFAAGWVQDEKGWKYQNAYGTFKKNEWFRDYTTGDKYYFDTFGYMQTGLAEIGGKFYYFNDAGSLRGNGCFPEMQVAIDNEGVLHSSEEGGLLLGQITQYNAEMNAVEVKICNMRNVPIVLQGTAEVFGSGINEQWYLVNNTEANIMGNSVVIPALSTVSYYFGAMSHHALNFKDFKCSLKCHYTCDGNDSYWVI